MKPAKLSHELRTSHDEYLREHRPVLGLALGAVACLTFAAVPFVLPEARAAWRELSPRTGGRGGFGVGA